MYNKRVITNVAITRQMVRRPAIGPAESEETEKEGKEVVLVPLDRGWEGGGWLVAGGV